MGSLAFDPIKHEYTDGTRKLVSVTEVLRVVGYAEDYSRYAEKYRQRGQAVHRACALADADRLDLETTHTEIVPFVKQYLNFKHDTGFVGLTWEFGMVDQEQGVAGTADVLGRNPDGDLWLVDLKSGTIPKCVGVQLAGYLELGKKGKLIEDNPVLDKLLKTEKIIPKSLNLPTDGKYSLRSHPEPRHVVRWRAAVTVYHAREEFGTL